MGCDCCVTYGTTSPYCSGKLPEAILQRLGEIEASYWARKC